MEDKMSRHGRAIRANSDVVDWNVKIIDGEMYLQPLVTENFGDRQGGGRYSVFGVYKPNRENGSILYIALEILGTTSEPILDESKILGHNTKISGDNLRIPLTRSLKDGDISKAVTIIIRTIQSYLANSVEPPNEVLVQMLDFVEDMAVDAFSENVMTIIDKLAAFVNSIPDRITEKYFDRNVIQSGSFANKLAYLSGDDWSRSFFDGFDAFSELNFKKIYNEMDGMQNGKYKLRPIEERIARVKELKRMVKRALMEFQKQVDSGDLKFSPPRSGKDE